MTTKQEGPRCQLCVEHIKIFIGRMNGTDIYFCPKCDRVNKK